MEHRAEDEKRQRIEQLIEAVRNRWSREAAAEIAAFIEHHYRNGATEDLLPRALEILLTHTTHSWQDEFRRQLQERVGAERGEALYQRYHDAFPMAYQAENPPAVAVEDALRLEALSEENTLGLQLYRPDKAAAGTLRLKIYHLGQPITLSAALPVLENLGVEVIDERPYAVTPTAGRPGGIRDLGLRYPAGLDDEEERLQRLFPETLTMVWQGRAENDGFNKLSLHAGLDWREITILRAYGKYLRQAGTTLSQALIEATLAHYPHIARDLVQLFHARLSPSQRDPAQEQELVTRIEAAFNDVPGLDEDRILRRYLAAIRATQRTNFYRRNVDGSHKSQLALKLIPEQIPDMPLPLPAYEIYVYSPRFEGVHLRAGKVARGGIRWSDRQEDFRTEVLGLLKAQVVKNSIIVPVGAKGSFCPKRLPQGDREAIQAEVKACYADFIRGLLDITDNRVGDRVVPPPDVVRHDGDDPYLVVAADKGTATFSDLANSVAAEYDFWLRDAFASGGSTGYDHKKMGITARGAWVSVRRHFRELGLDPQSQDFTAVGIGDMSGDVFGNGMLMSPHIRLIGAFDHRHIFIDPNPDPAVAYEERKRLFQLPGSSWDDYDRSKISEGGGVWPRTAKSIKLSPQARKALDIDQETLSATELMQAILKAPVDLLWNGGIGTYVKASTESHAQVGDKNNDAIRVDGSDLRCRVVGEGGNLGFTQLGRIEYALKGGRINTDAIDNSGGVDCSDREVNIKILLSQVVDAGALGMAERDQLLLDMTDDVARLVLQDNYQQTQALSLAQRQAASQLDQYAALIRFLERAAGLDRQLEFLPSDDELAQRAADGRGLTRPELAVLLSYVKIHGYGKLLGSPLLDEPELEQMLFEYFPPQLTERFPDAIRGHQLRGEIKATALINLIVNRMGPSFLFRLQQQLGATIPEIARAFLAASGIFSLQHWWEQVDSLDGQVPADLQHDMLQELMSLQERAVGWIMLNLPRDLPVATVVERLKPAIDTLARELPKQLPETLGEHCLQQAQALRGAGVPDTLARHVAYTDPLYASLDIASISQRQGVSLQLAAGAYYNIGARLGITWLLQALREFTPADAWAARMRLGLLNDVYGVLRQLTTDALEYCPQEDPARCVEDWASRYREALERPAATLAELRSLPKLGLPMFAVVVQELKQLRRGAGDAALDWGPEAP
ncbi:MAG: NAD-glutamate dehydrogenase [Xanthomonadaceae bacterium]|nr:NAD-glutamate dehydrogenase [Xanthomonadaceae bacterium]